MGVAWESFLKNNIESSDTPLKNVCWNLLDEPTILLVFDESSEDLQRSISC